MICSTNNHRQRKRWNGALARMSSIASCHRRWLETGVRAAELQKPKQQQRRQNRGRQQQASNWRKEVHRSKPPTAATQTTPTRGRGMYRVRPTDLPLAEHQIQAENDQHPIWRYACSKLRLTVISTPPSCSTSSRRRSPARPFARDQFLGQRVRSTHFPTTGGRTTHRICGLSSKQSERRIKTPRPCRPPDTRPTVSARSVPHRPARPEANARGATIENHHEARPDPEDTNHPGHAHAVGDPRGLRPPPSKGPSAERTQNLLGLPQSIEAEASSNNATVKSSSSMNTLVTKRSKRANTFQSTNRRSSPGS